MLKKSKSKKLRKPKLAANKLKKTKFIRSSAINCTSKNPSNKGRFPSYIEDTLGYKYDNYYITIPIIDKIALLSDPFQDIEERTQFKKMMYKEWCDKKEGKVRSFLTKKQNLPKPPRYDDHYELRFAGIAEPVHFFIANPKSKISFLRFEYNPSKLGIAGYKALSKWYDENVMHHSFEKLCRKRKAISRLDIAFDIYGVHIADIIFRINEKVKTQEWKSPEGVLETVYLYNSSSKQSSYKVYDKLAELLYEDAGKLKPKKARRSDFEKEFLDGEWPITRIEKSIDRPAYSVYELYKLKFDAHFNNCICYLPLDFKKSPDSRKKWMMFLECVRYRGLMSALDLVAGDDTKKRVQYAKVLAHNKYDLLEDYRDRLNWHIDWKRSLESVGFYRAGR